MGILIAFNAGYIAVLVCGFRLLISLRRSSTTGRLLDWLGLLPVVRLHVPGLPDVWLASSVLISGGMISRGRRFLRRIAKDIGAPG